MAKDDYHVIVYKILLYLYGCLQRKIVFDQAVYDKTIEKTRINAEYLKDIYLMMYDEGLISGISVTQVWGGTRLMVSEESEMKITPLGIEYLKDNDQMKKVREYLIGAAETIVGLIKMVIP